MMDKIKLWLSEYIQSKHLFIVNSMLHWTTKRLFSKAFKVEHNIVIAELPQQSGHQIDWDQ